MDKKTYRSVDEYIVLWPVEVQQALREIRRTIKATAPEAEESIAYQMPAYKLNGRPLCYFAAFKKHIGFYPTPSGISSFEKELSKYEQGKGSVQFPLNQPMPLELIKEIVGSRVRAIKS